MDAKKLMMRALELAERGTGRVAPNPLVGAVIYKNGKIIAEGSHLYFGGAHAEINALRRAGSAAKGASLIINLEPCVHTGKTPPCAPAVAAAGIKEVVIGMKDPNPLVSGRGIKYLRSRGLKVKTGVLFGECRFLNRAFVSAHERKRPWVVLKEGLSLDGKIATRTGNSKWITNAKARVFAHELRYESDIIMAGASTFRKDRPSLEPYLLKKKKHPLGYPARCVVTRTGDLRGCMKSVDKEGTVVAVRGKYKGVFRKARVVRFGGLKNLLGKLCSMGYNSVLLEGGGGLAGSFFDADLIDEVFFIYAPVVIGGKSAVPAVSGVGKGKVSSALSFERWELLDAKGNFIFHGVKCSRV